MKGKIPGIISFVAMAALVAMMVAATVVERLKGTDAAFSAVYHNPLFIALWAAAAICGLLYMYSKRVWKRFFTMTLHVAFVVMLLGALVTHLWGESGEMHLYTGETSSSWTADNGTARQLPFTLTLDNFRIEYYPGSMAPSDYESRVRVDSSQEAVISMNNILKHGGYRFYQADFDKDMGGSVLAVSHDPWGVGITYAGYLLLLISMVGFFTQKDSGFKASLKRLSSAAVLAFALLLPANASAAPRSLPRKVVSEFDSLYIYYNDRVAPFETMARDYCMKVYGKPHYGKLSATEVVTGWLFYYDDWKDVPMKVKKKDRGTVREKEKKYLLEKVSSLEALRLYPVAVPDSLSGETPQKVLWYDSTADFPPYVLENYDHWVFVRKVMDMVNESVRAQDWDGAAGIVSKIGAYQRKTAGALLPSPARLGAERLYNRISRPMIPFMASITLGIVMFILMGIWISRGKSSPVWLRSALAALSCILAVYLTAVLALRWYVSGHAPFAGSYSVMMIIAWLSAIVMTLTYRKFPLIQPLGFILSGFTMLMASMASANPQITHLMPVLQSPLLSIHVLSMMISYTLFGIVALNGIMGVIVPKGGPAEKLRDVSLAVLYPAVFLITFGTFLGAVWANISWGSYWGWDPKETWALVTILVYAVTLHSGSLKFMRNVRVFHWYSIFAFVSVLFTYFGVNLILGGMHSYM